MNDSEAWKSEWEKMQCVFYVGFSPENRNLSFITQLYGVIKRYVFDGGDALAIISSACSCTLSVSIGACSILKAVILWFGIDSANPNLPPSFL